MDKILHDPKDPKLWELWYIPLMGNAGFCPSAVSLQGSLGGGGLCSLFAQATLEELRSLSRLSESFVLKCFDVGFRV